MAYFLEQYSNMIKNANSYEDLTKCIEYCISKNIVSSLGADISKRINELSFDTPCYDFVKIMVWAATVSEHTPTCLEILREFCNNIVRNYEKLPYNLDSLTLLITVICADNKEIIHQLTDDQRNELVALIVKIYVIESDIDIKDSFILSRSSESINLIMSGKSMQEIDLLMADDYDENSLMMDIVRPFQSIFINIYQNISQPFLLKKVNEYLWKISLENKIEKCIYIFTSKYPETKNDDYNYFVHNFIMICKEYNDNIVKTGYNLQSSPVNPIYGKLVWDFLDLLHYSYSNMNFDTKKIVHLLNHCTEIFYNSFCVVDQARYGIDHLRSAYVDSDKYEDSFYQKSSIEYKSIQMYLNSDKMFQEWKREFVNKGLSKDQLSKLYITRYYNPKIELADELLMNAHVILEANYQTDENTDEDDIKNSDKNEKNDTYDGPEIEATQSKKGYKKMSKIQADGERKIYRAYKKYKNAESKVDSQLTKMLESAKRAFSQDKTEEIIEGKRFTPIGLLKKILTTSAIFSFSTIGGFIYLLVSHTLSKKRTLKQKKEILLEIESEIKMLDEKIEDARGDGNRKAKYALMRTRTELTRARDKIRYNLTATKEDMKTAKSYLTRDNNSKEME